MGKAEWAIPIANFPLGALSKTKIVPVIETNYLTIHKY